MFCKDTFRKLLRTLPSNCISSLGLFTETLILLPALWEACTSCSPGSSSSCHMPCFGQWKMSTKEMCQFSWKVSRSIRCESCFECRDFHARMLFKWLNTKMLNREHILFWKTMCVFLVHKLCGIFAQKFFYYDFWIYFNTWFKHSMLCFWQRYISFSRNL